MRKRLNLSDKKTILRIALISISIVAIIGIGLAANPKSLTSFEGSSYRVEEILYQAPMYSFFYTLDTTPQYCISSDYVFYSKQPSDEDWVMHGGLDPYKINRQELRSRFILPSENVLEAINKTKLIYRVDIDDDNKTFYLVMQLKNEDVFLALGHDKEENPHIRWLFRLGKLNDTNQPTIHN